MGHREVRVRTARRLGPVLLSPSISSYVLGTAIVIAWLAEVVKGASMNRLHMGMGT